MYLKIDDYVFELTNFFEQHSSSRNIYTPSMLWSEAESHLDILKNATYFDFVNGETSFHFEDVQFDKYIVTSNNEITFYYMKEIGARLNQIIDCLSEQKMDVEQLSEVVDFLALYGNNDLFEEEDEELLRDK